MARKQKAPAVVAELGRPETPAETAARKANDSRLYRQRKTVNNLVFSLIVSLGLMLVIVLMAPGLIGGKSTFEDHSVDVAALAAEAAPSAGRTLVAPAAPDAWKAKSAGLRQRDGVVSWQIDYTTVDETTGHEAYAAVVQAFTPDGAPVDEKWISQALEQQSPTGAEQIGGIDWVVYDHPDRDPDSSNMVFGLQGEWQGDTILVYGTDTPATLRVLAADVAASLTTPKEQ
ncbi:DUF4245 family protein [Leucobacter tenebrionis]|uniref:DUF4245 family protein n=1 Tax=Leucobacter tenebrionis TaxID=2873270 RepID=UPI001CA71067|nr:DUF4245 family protein [Leucobacter tenebrionis]QZY51469.1 DUF4245 domain-containing protein [Leucobacter tenebrionis]